MESMDHIAAESNPPQKKILFKKKKKKFIFFQKKQATAVEESEGCVKNAMELGPLKKKKTFEGGAKQMTNARLVPPFGSPLIHPRVFVLCDEQK